MGDGPQRCVIGAEMVTMTVTRTRAVGMAGTWEVVHLGEAPRSAASDLAWLLAWRRVWPGAAPVQRRAAG